MNYATYDDLALRFGATALTQLTDRDQTGAPDIAVIEAALTDAASLVDGYAAGRYATPLSPTPDPVKRWCADIAWYYLHGDTPPEQVRRAFDDAMTGLKDMARGALVFQAAGTALKDKAGGIRAEIPASLFTADALRDF